MSSEEWSSESYSSNDGIEYSVHRIQESEYRRPEECKLVVVGLNCEGGEDCTVVIPCFECDHNHIGDKEHYLENHAWLVQNLVSDHYPNMPRTSVEEVSRSVISAIELANSLHRPCIYKEPVTVVHNVYIDFPLPMESVQERYLRESFQPAPMPASVDSLEELFTIKRNVEDIEGDRFEIGWCNAHHECVICLDEIQTRKSSLTMPCSHVFHQDCLVQWLHASHVCPLCRHQLPTHDSSV